MVLENIVNIFAMIFSFIGSLMLLYISTKIGGSMGKMIKLIVAGIFLSVFFHAAFELAGAFGFIDESTLLIIMGFLLTAGSLLFIFGAYTGIKAIR